MSILEALILGIVQGLTEFLPISSSGHLEIGKVLLNVDAERSFLFTLVVHGATVLSTLVVFRKEIGILLSGFFKFKWNEETEYISKLLVSLIPVALVGFLLKDSVESLFDGNIILVGAMLLVAALLLALSGIIRRPNPKPLGFGHALVIGIAQAIAVIPGISRSGATISTGLMIGNNRNELAKFSFLMVIIPVIGANLLEVVKGGTPQELGVGFAPLAIGFLAAFVSGYLACRWMVSIVKKGNLKWFALYCAIAGAFCFFIG